jgi:hypothetical protein
MIFQTLKKKMMMMKMKKMMNLRRKLKIEF